jgi:hypothetical protein
MGVVGSWEASARKLLLRGAGRVGARRGAGSGCEGVWQMVPALFVQKGRQRLGLFQERLERGVVQQV